MGTPGAGVIVLDFGADGAPSKVIERRIGGTAEPYVSFHATYAPAAGDK
jgi:hypothetical protein